MELTQLQTNIAEAIDGSNQKITEQLVAFFVEKEVKRRVEASTIAVQEIEKLQKDALKIKADQFTYDADGKELSATFSKAKVDEKKKLNDRIEKLKKALEKALTSNDFGDLFNTAQKDSGDKPAAKEGEAGQKAPSSNAPAKV